MITGNIAKISNGRGENNMRNSVKIWIIAICVMLIMGLTGVVGWTIGYQDHKKIDQTSKNLSEMTEETKEEMI